MDHGYLTIPDDDTSRGVAHKGMCAFIIIMLIHIKQQSHF